jgi:hypothetical protein
MGEIFHLFVSENAEIELQKYKEATSENGTISEEQIESEFIQMEEIYKEKNLIPKEMINKLLDDLSMQIRNELKTK